MRVEKILFFKSQVALVCGSNGSILIFWSELRVDSLLPR